LHYGKSSGIISDNKLIHFSLCYKYYHTMQEHKYYAMQGRNERVQGGSNSPGAEITMGGEWLRGRRKLFTTMLQILPSIQQICFHKTSDTNMGAPNLLLAPGAI